LLAALGGVPLVWKSPSLWVRSLAGSVSDIGQPSACGWPSSWA
jgi:hypothetical protein